MPHATLTLAQEILHIDFTALPSDFTALLATLMRKPAAPPQSPAQISGPSLGE